MLPHDTGKFLKKNLQNGRKKWKKAEENRDRGGMFSGISAGCLMEDYLYVLKIFRGNTIFSVEESSGKCPSPSPRWPPRSCAILHIWYSMSPEECGHVLGVGSGWDMVNGEI